jgi:cytochrome c oxidase assembly factor CtaG
MSYVLAHWSPGWVVLAIWAAAAAAHLCVWRDGAWRSAAFHGGLLAVLLALVSPLAYWSLTFIWVRSIQDLLLAVVAPALIMLGAPLRLRSPGARGTRGSLAGPVAVTLAFNVVWLGGHVPALYDLAAANTAARYVQWAAYLAAGIVFWRQLIGPGRSGPAVDMAQVAPMRRLALLVATAAADTILGMVLVFGSGLVYPAYRGAGHHVLSVVADQQVGGAVLWMGMLPPLIIATVALVLGWLEHEECDELSRELDRLTGQTPAAGSPPQARRPAWASSARAAWPARAGYRRPTF